MVRPTLLRVLENIFLKQIHDHGVCAIAIITVWVMHHMYTFLHTVASVGRPTIQTRFFLEPECFIKQKGSSL